MHIIITVMKELQVMVILTKFPSYGRPRSWADPMIHTVLAVDVSESIKSIHLVAGPAPNQQKSPTTSQLPS